MRRGEIYWVDFGTPKGSEQGGRRPALVIQNDSGNSNSPTTIIAALTSKKKRAYPFHVEVSASESSMSEDGTILLEQIFTVDQSRLIKRIGILTVTKMREVDKAIHVSLSLSSP